MKHRYRMIARSGYLIETAIDKSPIPGLAKHLGIPDKLTADVMGFTAKYVESFDNLNRAYFSNDELALAHDSIPFKPLDLEHEIEDVIGHLHSHAYIDRTENRIVTMDELKQMSEGKRSDLPIDVLVGAIAYIDRYPQLEAPLSRKAYCLSMECYFDRWDLRLENGVTMTLEEAEAVGLGLFIEQLMGSFETKEEFDNAHSLLVTLASKKQEQMKVYKHLRNIMFSGAGAVLTPACPSCHILSTSCDDAKLQDAASCECPDKVKDDSKEEVKAFSLDLRQVDSYMKKVRDANEIPATNIQVTEQIEAAGTENANEIEMQVQETVPWTPDDTIRPAPPTLMPPPSTVQHTPVDINSHAAPCLNYKFGVDVEFTCSFADINCETAGDRKDKRCRRWFQDERGTWKFDTRNHINEGKEEVVINTNMEEVVVVDDQASINKDKEWINIRLEKLVNDLEVVRIERELEKSAFSKEDAAWTTKMINGLPNSSFAVVETGYKDGMNKNARHLPFKDSGGKVDLPHLRNALARVNQIKSVLGNDSDSDLHARAERKLTPYAKRFLKTSKENEKKDDK
jgi:hypothetical protein